MIRFAKVVSACLLGAFLLSSCASPRTDPKILVGQWMSYMRNRYTIQPGDRLRVSLEGQPDLTQEVVVDPKGRAAFLEVGSLDCSGMTLESLRKELKSRYAKHYSQPRVDVILLEPSEQVVYVGGEVRRGGEAIPYRPGMTLMRAILAAGGFMITAKPSEVFLLRQDPEGKPLFYRIDADKVAYEGGMDIPLLPNDAIFVQTSGVADVGNWVELYIRRLLPIQPGTVVGAYVGASARN